MPPIVSTAFDILAILFTAVVAVYATRLYLLTVAGVRSFRAPRDSSYTPFISILVPAHNEGMVIERTITRLLQLNYPPERLEIVIVNDASTDQTAETLERFARQGLIKAVHRTRALKPGGMGTQSISQSIRGLFFHKELPLPGGGGRGKSAAMNSALRFLNPRSEVLVLFDADHYPEKETILRDFVKYMYDPEVCIVQGDVRTINADTNLLTNFVAAERDGANLDQNGRSVLGLLPQHSGTVAAIRLSFLQELGGWDDDALCDDTDITFAAALRGLRVVYDPDIVSWEEGVDNLRAYVKQRTRWARGHMRVFAKYWFPVMFSPLPLRQKIDGFLLLSFYFVPICVGLSMALTALDFLLLRRTPSALDGVGTPIFLYCAPALFLQLVSGLYYRRAKVQRYFGVMLLPLFSLLNIVICFRALRMEIFGIQRNVWVKTQRTGKVMKDLAVIQANTPLPVEAVLEASHPSQRPAQ